MQLAQSGVHSDELERIIASAPQINFLLNPASTDVMLKAGVSEDVIKAMAARENGTQAPTASAASPAKSARNDYRAAVPATAPTAIPAAPVTRVAGPISQHNALVAGSYQVPREGGGHKVTYDGGSIPNLKTVVA